MNGKEYKGIDIIKFVMAILVITLHVYPFEGINDSLHYYTIHWFSRIAVPFFFISTGFFLFKNDNEKIMVKRIKRYLIKIFKLYCIWSVIYLPWYLKDRVLGKGYSMIQLIFFAVRDFFFAGSYTHLWYLPATIVAVAMVALVKRNRIAYKIVFPVAFVLYGVGLLGQSYNGLLNLFIDNNTLLQIIWQGMHLITATTRNGVFFGFLFVLTGAYIAEKELKFTKGLFLTWGSCMLLFFVEVFMLRSLGWIKDGNMYVCMYPVVVILFVIVSNWEPKWNINYRDIRDCSSLVFYVHLWIAGVLKLIEEYLVRIGCVLEINSLLKFFIVTILSILLSYSICLISKKKKILHNIY